MTMPFNLTISPIVNRGFNAHASCLFENGDWVLPVQKTNWNNGTGIDEQLGVL